MLELLNVSGFKGFGGRQKCLTLFVLLIVVISQNCHPTELIVMLGLLVLSECRKSLWKIKYISISHELVKLVTTAICLDMKSLPCIYVSIHSKL